MKTGIEIISEERQRQISDKGWTIQHDDIHVDGELAQAAGCYVIRMSYQWPWDDCELKLDDNNRIKELAKAGALIAAEIDRLQRLKL